jgi:hypothetical protein
VALMVRYCEKHRHAWPIADGRGKKKCCPAAEAAFGDRAGECPITSVDAIRQINDLGGELEAVEEAEADGG